MSRSRRKWVSGKVPPCATARRPAVVTGSSTSRSPSSDDSDLLAEAGSGATKANANGLGALGLETWGAARAGGGSEGMAHGAPSRRLDWSGRETAVDRG